MKTAFPRRYFDDRIHETGLPIARSPLVPLSGYITAALPRPSHLGTISV
jgi:hypothetical protein